MSRHKCNKSLYTSFLQATSIRYSGLALSEVSPFGLSHDKKAYRELETHHWSKEELRKYEQEEKYARDAMARERYVIMEAKAEAREEGRQEGIELGIEEGRNAEKLAIAKNLLSLGIDKKKISESTGLSFKEIEGM